MKTDISRVHLAALLYARLIRSLGDVGIRIELREDFHAFTAQYGAMSRKPAYPVFDPAQSDISAETGFWVAALAGDEVVGLQAMRRWRMDRGLVAHLRRHVRLYCLVTDAHIDPDKTRIADKGLAHLAGDGWYHGQLWLNPAWRDRDAGGMPLGRRLLPRVATLAAFMAGPPDFIWGMAPDPAAERGIIASYGFYHTHMDALAFHDAAGALLWHETILWSTRSDIIAEMERTSERMDLSDRQRGQSVNRTPIALRH